MMQQDSSDTTFNRPEAFSQLQPLTNEEREKIESTYR